MENARRIVILGGTRGLGRAMALEFLTRGHSVFITGRNADMVARAVREIGAEAVAKEAGRIGGGAGDVSRNADLERLVAESLAFLGGMDHWIFNAGVNQEPGRIVDLEPAEMERVVGTDLLGPMYAARAAKEALRASGGFLWLMEGHGSAGRIIDGLSLYGTAKRGLAYLWRALAKEAERDSFRVGGLSPGIMATDFILQNREKEGPEKWKRSARMFNILADRPETVAAFLVPRILGATENGTLVEWLTTSKVLFRFLTARVAPRRIVE